MATIYLERNPFEKIQNHLESSIIFRNENLRKLLKTNNVRDENQNQMFK